MKKFYEKPSTEIVELESAEAVATYGPGPGGNNGRDDPPRGNMGIGGSNDNNRRDDPPRGRGW